MHDKKSIEQNSFYVCAGGDVLHVKKKKTTMLRKEVPHSSDFSKKKIESNSPSK